MRKESREEYRKRDVRLLVFDWLVEGGLRLNKEEGE